jgi:phosphoenolpyruvate-protein phosphotransferase
MPLQVLAPFDGWCTSLDEVPDPVFAGRMLGDGVAIDPLAGSVIAPCDGEIIALPASSHAVSLRAAEGVEILLHIGIDTVELKGRGFEPRVALGAHVKAGDELIRFDLDVVARHAKSLITPILVQSDGAVVEQQHAIGAVSAGELLFTVRTLRVSQVPMPAAASEPLPSSQSTLKMPLQQGVHARPAALIAQRAKGFEARVNLSAHGRSANARSIVALMALGVRHGDEVTISASGRDAGAAIEGIRAGIDEALRLEAAAHSGVAQRASAPRPAAADESGAELGGLRGITAVPGFAVGRATRIERRAIEVAEQGSTVARETAELERAQNEVRVRLQRLAAAGSATRREIIKAHLEFLDDPSLNSAAGEHIAAGKSAGFAWRGAVRESIEALELLDDPRLRERADDLLDIEAHVLMALVGEARPMILPLPERAVLIAADLLPSELTALDRQRLSAICLSGGGATSHVAILAAAMEIPMLVGLGSGLREIAEGTTVVVDADNGRLETTPSESVVAAAESKVEARLLRGAEQRVLAQADCYSRDGTRVEVFANLGNVTEAAVAVDNGAEGCGLLRTEFLFIDRDTAPSEQEQYQAYQEIAAALAGRPLILRLMDVGGDKPLRYLPLPHEDNPALGLRGVRTVLARPDLMRDQLRAALRVRPIGKVRLLLPMVTDVAEVRAVREVCDQLRAELSLHSPVEIGAMIETPAAALTAARLIREVDFLSIGSNDLTQYTLAMDRGHPQLAARTDALHPAVLRLIAAAGAAGVAAGKLVAVCGGVAADRAAVPVLLGLGVRELSVVPGAIPAIKQRVRALDLLECRDLAMRCLELASAAEVRELIAHDTLTAGGVP